MTNLRIGQVARLGLAAMAAASLASCGLLPGGGDEDESSGESPSWAGSWEQQAAAIEDLVDYRQSRPELLGTEHTDGPVSYEVVPPVGGPHNGAWQNCQGVVYDAAIADEHAVHSLEHGAVWIAYHPALPADQVAALADRVEGNDKLFMSPYPQLDAPISLQVWGYQLKLDAAGDPRIDEFIRILRVNTAPEPEAPCSGGVTSTGTDPVAS